MWCHLRLVEFYKASVREDEVCNYCDTLASFPAPREVFLSFQILLNRFNPCNIKHWLGWGESTIPLSLCRPGMHSVKIAGMQNMWYAACWPRLQFHYRHQHFYLQSFSVGECWFRLWFPSLCLSTLFLCAKTLHWSLNCSMNNGLFTPRTETITINIHSMRQRGPHYSYNDNDTGAFFFSADG